MRVDNDEYDGSPVVQDGSKSHFSSWKSSPVEDGDDKYLTDLDTS